MTRPSEAADLRLWREVISTIRPLYRRKGPQPDMPRLPTAPVATPATHTVVSATPARLRQAPGAAAPHLDATRHRRLARGKDALDGAIDLHGLGHDAARANLTGFILSASARGRRAVLVITGKGVSGEGLLRRLTPEWLAEAPLRSIVSGVATAHRRHGGQGALYVTLKRRAAR